MVLLKFLTIYLLLIIASHYFIHAVVLKRFDVPNSIRESIGRMSPCQQVIGLILMTPIFVILAIAVGLFHMYWGILLLFARFRMFRANLLFDIVEKWGWYKRRLLKKRIIYHISVFLFGKLAVQSAMNIVAVGILGKIIISILNENGIETTNTVSD